MSEFMQGVSLVAHLSTFLWCAFGASLGIILGALPGLTATMGIALVIPISYQLDTATGIGLLLAVYCGAVCGVHLSRRFFLEFQEIPTPSQQRKMVN